MKVVIVLIWVVGTAWAVGFGFGIIPPIELPCYAGGHVCR